MGGSYKTIHEWFANETHGRKFTIGIKGHFTDHTIEVYIKEIVELPDGDCLIGYVGVDMKRSDPTVCYSRLSTIAIIKGVDEE